MFKESIMSLKPSLLLERVKTQKPVVHHITNWVTIYDCANIVKAFGASPVMAHAPEEVAAMTGIASSLVLNIGTLTTELVEAMKIAAKRANTAGIPIVLDVCGAGATKFRDEKSAELLKAAKINIVKGNASEIARVAGENVLTKGVDATDISGNIAEIAARFAGKQKCTVVVTGKEDVVTDGKTTYIIKNGAQMMTHVVGTGCMAASVIGAFAAVEKDLALAATAGLACYEIAAEEAAAASAGPGSFKEKLFDAIYQLDAREADGAAKIEIL